MNEKYDLDPKVREVYEKAGLDLDEVAKSAAKGYKQWKREHSPLKKLARLTSFTFRSIFGKVIPFQCHHCGKTFYAPSEEEMETMMENHLYESHRAEWEKILRPGKKLKREDFEELVELGVVTPCMPSSHWELTYTKSDGTRNTVSLKDSVEQLAARIMAKEEEHKDHDFAWQLVFVNKDGDRLVFTARELKEEYYRVACWVSAPS
jgi:hypothetical protein